MINEDLKSRTKINQEPDYLHSKYEHLNGDFKGNEPSIDIVQEENQKFGYNSQKKRNNLNSLGENKSNFIQKIESNSNYNFINLDDYLPHYSDIFNLFQHYFQGNSSNFNILNSNSAKILLNIFSGHELFHFLAKYASLYSIKLYKINILSIFTDNIDENLLKLKNELLDLSTARKNCKIIIIIPLEHYNKLFNSFPAAYLKIFEILRSIFLYKDQILLFLQKNDSDSRLPIENTSFFDFSLNIRLPNTEDQKKYICIFAQEMKLEDLDIDIITLHMKDWNYLNIRKFFEYTKIYYEINRNKDTNQNLMFNTTFILKLLEKRIFYIPVIHTNSDIQFKRANTNIRENKPSKSLKYSNSFLKQLYQNAASNDFEELIIIIDKTKKGSPLQLSERIKLSDYNFILLDEPDIAIRKLNDAKSIIDNMKRLN